MARAGPATHACPACVPERDVAASRRSCSSSPISVSRVAIEVRLRLFTNEVGLLTGDLGMRGDCRELLLHLQVESVEARTQRAQLRADCGRPSSPKRAGSNELAGFLRAIGNLRLEGGSDLAAVQLDQQARAAMLVLSADRQLLSWASRNAAYSKC